MHPKDPEDIPGSPSLSDVELSFISLWRVSSVLFSLGAPQNLLQLLKIVQRQYYLKLNHINFTDSFLNSGSLHSRLQFV